MHAKWCYEFVDEMGVNAKVINPWRCQYISVKVALKEYLFTYVAVMLR